MAFKDLSQKMRDKILAATPSTGGNKLSDGNYLLIVDALLCAEKRGGEFFTVETVVEECEVAHEGVVPNAVGTRVSALHTNLTTNDAAASNMKQALCAILALPDAVANEIYLKAIETNVGADSVSHPQPCRGMYVGVETYRNETKKGPNAGKWGTYPRFVHVPGQKPAEIAERRAVLERAAAAAKDTAK